MTREKKITLAGLVAGALLAMRVSDFVPGASARQEHHHAHAPASAKQLKNPLTATEENIASGRALFNQHCASCHGSDGRARSERAAAMKVKPADLTSDAVRNLTPGEIYWVITNGIKSSGMPAFRAKMKERERWQAMLYVRHLQGEHEHADTARPGSVSLIWGRNSEKHGDTNFYLFESMLFFCRNNHLYNADQDCHG